MFKQLFGRDKAAQVAEDSKQTTSGHAHESSWLKNLVRSLPFTTTSEGTLSTAALEDAYEQLEDSLILEY